MSEICLSGGHLFKNCATISKQKGKGGGGDYNVGYIFLVRYSWLCIGYIFLVTYSQPI